MLQQFLPNYKHDFESFSYWITKESEHYIFHYTAKSEAEKDIHQIVTTQEDAFSKIVTTLDLQHPDKKIEYYFYPDAELKKNLMGDDWFAQSIYNEFRIHVLFTKDDKPIGPHEDTHLLSLPWGISWNFLQEGLAEYMVGRCWDGVPHEDKVKGGIALGLKLSPSTQLTQKDWLDIPDESIIYFYALAGSWSRFLIETYGMGKYKEFYKNTNREMGPNAVLQAYSDHFGKKLTKLEEEYFSTFHYIKNQDLSRSVR